MTWRRLTIGATDDILNTIDTKTALSCSNFYLYLATLRSSLVRPLFPALVCTLIAVTPVLAEYTLENAFPALTFSGPTDIQHAGDGTNRLFVTEKSGRIWVLRNFNGETQKSLFLDLSDKVGVIGEAGLLGIAFHPDYASNGYFYVTYVTPHPYHSILARYTVGAFPNIARDDSELIIIDSPQTSFIHNGGQIAFGPDGYLYYGMGDTSERRYAQELDSIKGSLLRIDVDTTTVTDNYGIPPDNPFAGNNIGDCEEIYAYGFRNPWRFSIEPTTGRIWLSDVGEDTYEEINLIKKGGNYGWYFMEGFECLDPNRCDFSEYDLKPPLYVYDHTQGLAIIGGAVYRGKTLWELAGNYLYADYSSGNVWALRFDGAFPPSARTLISNAPFLLTFGTDQFGEPLFGGGDGKLYRITAVPSAVESVSPPATRVLGNYPNPFNPETTLRYETGNRGFVALRVFSADGRLVRTINIGEVPPGSHAATWNGRNDRGHTAPTGVYYYVLTLDGTHAGTGKMVLLK